jgi:SAM-dependent methyltransferase
MSAGKSMGTDGDALTQSLDLLSDTYNYNLWVYSLLRPKIGESVLEVGAGVGNLTRFLLDRKSVVCLEPDPAYAAALRDLAAMHRNIQVLGTGLAEDGAAAVPGATFDTVLCVNVLEHIRDDVAGLKSLLANLAPGGALLLYVPACPFAFGTLDASLGHYRRYSKRSLRRLAAANGASLRLCRFVNMPGIFGWFWASRVSRDTRIEPRKARFVDRLAPYISAFERIIPPPIGQSLFAVIVK